MLEFINNETHHHHHHHMDERLSVTVCARQVYTKKSYIGKQKVTKSKYFCLCFCISHLKILLWINDAQQSMATTYLFMNLNLNLPTNNQNFDVNFLISWIANSRRRQPIQNQIQWKTYIRTKEFDQAKNKLWKIWVLKHILNKAMHLFSRMLTK